MFRLDGIRFLGLDALQSHYIRAQRRIGRQSDEQVKRNADRFPGDFMFQLGAAEKAEVVANCDHLAKLIARHLQPQ